MSGRDEDVGRDRSPLESRSGVASAGGNPNFELRAVACSECKGARGGGGPRAGCPRVFWSTRSLSRGSGVGLGWAASLGLEGGRWVEGTGGRTAAATGADDHVRAEFAEWTSCSCGCSTRRGSHGKKHFRELGGKREKKGHASSRAPLATRDPLAPADCTSQIMSF